MQRFHDRVRVSYADDAVAWLVMEKGDLSMNVFTTSMVDAMTEAVESAQGAVDCLVLRGEEEFSVGADLQAIEEMPREMRPAKIDNIAAASNRFIRALRSFRAPVLAAVNGTAAGGGLGFALACDLLVMHVDSVLDPAYARIGLTPDNATPFFLARALGQYRACELMFNPRPIDAQEAHDLGLSSDSYDGDGTAFDEQVNEFASKLASGPTSVHGMAKSLIDTAFEDTLDEHLEKERNTIKNASDSKVFTEGLDAFFAGREPNWPSGDVTGDSD